MTLLLFVELCCLLGAGVLALVQAGAVVHSLKGFIGPAVLFAVVIVCLNGAFGLYRQDSKLTWASYAGRLSVALLIGAPASYLIVGLLPGGEQFRETFGTAVLLAFVGLIAARCLIVTPALREWFPRRVLVLGTGPEAGVVEAALAGRRDVRLVGFYPLEKVKELVVPPSRVVCAGGRFEDMVEQLGIREVIIAVREQRGGVLPLRSLLECRLNGVRVTDLAAFFESTQNLVPIDSLKASWLIYGDGFRQGRIRHYLKRAFDLIVATTLLVMSLPLMVLAALLIHLESGGPILYRQERVGYRGKTYEILKFRSMRNDAEKDRGPSWATERDPRVTAVGRMLRRSRIDELPQLINVIRGEMSLVGPRPERPMFVAMLTERIPFYAVRHSVKPGLTGWAQVRYSYGATVEESLKKLEYDLFYVKNHTLLLDLFIMFETIRVVLLGEGAR